VSDPTLYLFDGHNLLHAGEITDPRELRDALASFLATRGARGVLVFDGSGRDERHGPLEVRYAPDADTLLERLAAEHRRSETVCLVSSDAAVWGTAGQEVRKLSSRAFLGGLEAPRHRERPRTELGDRLDAVTRARLERLRRGFPG
jgi:predicted RNA-binding protein with PIN domain